MQLVELQSKMAEFMDEGVAVFALSYDDVETLGSFAEGHDIAYDLLSDEGSRTIQRLGLLNEHAEEQQAFYGRKANERHVGIPHPGTFVIDERGVILDKIFEQSYRSRAGAGFLFRQVTSGSPQAATSVVDASGPVVITAWIDSTDFRPLQLSDLHLRFQVAEDWHVYTTPIPDGFVPLEVRIDACCDFKYWKPELPGGRDLVVQGLPGSFRVLDGTFDVVVRYQLAGAGLDIQGRSRPNPGDPGAVTLDAYVEYQACSDTECLPPTRRRLSLTVHEKGSGD